MQEGISRVQVSDISSSCLKTNLFLIVILKDVFACQVGQKTFMA